LRIRSFYRPSHILHDGLPRHPRRKVTAIWAATARKTTLYEYADGPDRRMDGESGVRSSRSEPTFKRGPFGMLCAAGREIIPDFSIAKTS